MTFVRLVQGMMIYHQWKKRLRSQNVKLHLQLSTAASLTEGLKTDGEDILTHRFERESFNKDFCFRENILERNSIIHSSFTRSAD